MTTEPATTGWHPDPFGRHPFRWWDGQAWTAYTGDGTAVQWDPTPIEEVEEREPGLPGIVLAFLAFAVGVGLGVLLGVVVESSERERAGEIVLASLALWTPLVAALVFISRRRGTGSFTRDYAVSVRWSDIGFGVAGWIAGRLVSASFVAPIPFPSGSLDEIDEARFGDAIQGGWTWAALIFVTVVAAPLIEELFFRGLVQTRLVGRFGPVVGISVASLLFGAAHLIAWQGMWTFAYAWAITGAGLVLGTIFHLTKRLGTPILAHAFFNGQAMIVLAWLG